MAITLLPCTTYEVVTGGVAVQAVPSGPTGGFIQNPYSAEDQDVDPAEGPQILYVDPLNEPGGAPGSGNGTCFALYPGQSWSIIAGQNSQTRVNGPIAGQKFSGVYWV